MKQIKLENSNWTFAVSGMLIVAVFAFWKSYFKVFFTSEGFVHFHFFVAIVWFALLLIQPLLIQTRRVMLHRTIGKVSVLIASLVVLSILLLAHHRISTSPEEYYQFRTYLLYLQLSLAFVFGFTFGLGLYFKKNRLVHARLMMATLLSFLDPIIARILMGYTPWLEAYTQWISYGVIMLTLIFLSANDLQDQRTKWVFPSLAFLYTILWIPLLTGLTELSFWQAFAAWFVNL